MNIGFLHRDWQTNSAVKCKRWQSQNLNIFLTSCICFRHVFGNPGNVWEYTIPYSTCTCFTSNGDRETLIDTPILCSLSLQQFLGDLLKEAHKSQEVSEEQLIQYTDTMASDKTRTLIYLGHTFTPATFILSCSSKSTIQTRTANCSCQRWPSEYSVKSEEVIKKLGIFRWYLL